jgi:hypothetical protein
MKQNVGIIDRIIRILLGAALLTFALTSESVAAKFGWIGVIPLLTAFAGFCPLYSLLGMNSCACKKN